MTNKVQFEIALETFYKLMLYSKVVISIKDRMRFLSQSLRYEWVK